ncbi:sensor histidine kinase [Cryptosporangium japonicum]|uniref:histidine kinase n=1 Tax=Cryptosporangium japonicum TaxID=80872 RepID=A0ABN0UCA3_9ACTN
MADLRGHRVGAAASGLAGLALTAGTLVAAGASGVGWTAFVQMYALTNLVIGLSFLVPGVAIGWHVRGNRVGALLVVSGLGALSSACAVVLAYYALGHDWPEPVIRTLVTVFIGAWQLGLIFLFNLAVLLFPTDRLPSPRWRVVVVLVVVEGLYQIVTGILSDAPVHDDPRATSILSVGLRVEGTRLNDVLGWLGIVLTLLLPVSLVVRYRRGTEQVKRQILWLLLALLVFFGINAQRYLGGDGAILLLLSFVVIPVGIGIAIVRYELFDIRFVVSRALAYTATGAVIVAVYVALVASLSPVVGEGVPVGAALVVAFAFNPIRLRARTLLDHAFYGGRSDPARTARRVAARLQQSDELTDVLERAREALRLPWMALHRAGPDGARLAEAGTRTAGPTARIGLDYRGSTVGDLHLRLRSGETALHEADRNVLELICTPLAIALHALALSEQVRQARIATVEAGAVERVRLQHELHDELGPTLTSIAFRVDAAANTLARDADAAGVLMREIGTDLRDAIDGVRRIVYGLRPIELEDLGLVGAIRQRVTAVTAEGQQAVAIELRAPDHPLDLSPGVELAAYRIVMESITNVLRHSGGGRCTVVIAAGDGLELTITDDGDPPPEWHPGLGLRSLRDRAEELGGTAEIGPVPGGWAVTARLPRGHRDPVHSGG